MAVFTKLIQETFDKVVDFISPQDSQDCPKQCCAFLTDVEGNYDYFLRYVEISKVLRWSDDGKSLDLIDGATFVFGGDSQDKGTGDIRFVKTLLELKAKYPDRVFMIIGNRDANKLRLTTELSKEALESEIVKHDPAFPYWVSKDKVITPAAFCEANKISDDAVSRLKWILKETMGADGAFDRRREELKILKSGLEVSDDEVVSSYRDECDPMGGKDCFMLRYLEASHLAYRFGKVLFVHGAVTKDNLGTVPGQEAQAASVDEWVKGLNDWCREQLKDFRAKPYVGTNTGKRGGFGLTDYGVPKGNGGKTVVYDGNLKAGNAAPMEKPVLEYLNKSGINTVVCGHVPHGDCPTIITTKTARVITADTSYSAMGHKCSWGVDNRGDAVSEVLVWQDGSVDVHGVLADGNKIQYSMGPPRLGLAPTVGKRWIPKGSTLAFPGLQTEGIPFPTLGGSRTVDVEEDILIGKELKDQSWVKAKLKRLDHAEASKYVVCRGEGFKLITDIKTVPELEAIGFAEHFQPIPSCEMTVKVLSLVGAAQFAKDIDVMDPFIRMHLVDASGGVVAGSEKQTSFLQDAGGSATFNEVLQFTVPEGTGLMWVTLWDKNDTEPDRKQGGFHVKVDALWDNGNNNDKTLAVEVRMVRDDDRDHDVEKQLGHVVGSVNLEVTIRTTSSVDVEGLSASPAAARAPPPPPSEPPRGLGPAGSPAGATEGKP